MQRIKILAVVLALCILAGTASALADVPVGTEGITVPMIDDLKKFEIPEMKCF